jgi:hypothetical protein
MVGAYEQSRSRKGIEEIGVETIELRTVERGWVF